MLLPVISGLVFYAAISLIYYGKIASFLFFDEYANIIAGYFMTQGRMLYAENFFNHQMIPAYISYSIQKLTTPDTLYQLIGYHRIFVLLWSALWGIFLIRKTGFIGVWFVIGYEAVKYYLFGNLFLAESLIIYPLVYLFYLAWKSIRGDTINTLDYYIASFSAWFVIFSREPYIPLAFFLYAVTVFYPLKKFGGHVRKSFFLFLGACVLILLTVPLEEYIYQVVIVNFLTVFSDQLSRNAASGLGLPAILFYPFYTFVIGENTFMKKVLMLISAFLISVIILAYKDIKHKRLFLFVFITLACANIRVLKPGIEFYSAFYQIQWLGLAIISIALFIVEICKRRLKYGIILIVFATIGFVGIILTNPSYFVWEKQDNKALFTYNYDMFYITGQAIRILTGGNGTMFVDLSDSLTYWTGGLPSSYKYGVYYPVADALPRYRDERLKMFYTDPPDVYFTNCQEGIRYYYALPREVTERYAPVLFEGNPTCLFVSKAISQSLSDEKLSELESLHFSIADEFLIDTKNLVQ